MGFSAPPRAWLPQALAENSKCAQTHSSSNSLVAELPQREEGLGHAQAVALPTRLLQPIRAHLGGKPSCYQAVCGKR